MNTLRRCVKSPNFWIALAVMAVASEPAYAQNLDPITTMLTTIIGYLTGSIGRAIAIIAVIAAGFAMFTGRLNWPWFLGICLGTVLIFSAGTIIDGFSTT